tara:strand:+ start:1140 stop:1463 length:324 start_codon:yes stop_codon:yes gene_type:complete
MSYFINSTNIKLSQNIIEYLDEFNQYIDFEFEIIASDNSLSFTIETNNLNSIQIDRLLNVAQELKSTFYNYDEYTDTIDISIPRKGLNLGKIAIFILILRGVVWLRK